MAVESPVSHRLTHVALLLLTFATGLVDAVSVLELGHVFVANMTGNVIFLGLWLAPRTVVDVTAALVALVCFIAGAILGGRLARHLDREVRRWLAITLSLEVVMLVTLSILAGTGVLDYRDHTKLILDRGAGCHVRDSELHGASVRHPGTVHHRPDDDDLRYRLRQPVGRRFR